MRKARLAALWVSLAMPVLGLLGCSNGNTPRAANDSFAQRYPAPWWQSRPAYGQGTYGSAGGTDRICTPSEELAVTVAFGRVEGVEDTEDGKCSVYPNGARRVEYSVAVKGPEQCTPEGLAAFGYKLPRKPPVCN